MKSFFWMVVFPSIPSWLAAITAFSCSAAGIGVNGWWELVVGFWIVTTTAACWYGFGKGLRL